MEIKMNDITGTSKKRPDRRQIKTKRAIRDALITLMEDKDISQITIRELSDCADINRKTFYAHYNSVEDVLDEIEDNILAGLAELMRAGGIGGGSIDPDFIFRSINAIINKDIDFYSHFARTGLISFLQTKVKNFFRESLTEYIASNTDIDKATVPFVSEFIASGMVALYVDWFDGESRISLSELADLAANLMANGLGGIIGA